MYFNDLDFMLPQCQDLFLIAFALLSATTAQPLPGPVQPLLGAPPLPLPRQSEKVHQVRRGGAGLQQAGRGTQERGNQRHDWGGRYVAVDSAGQISL